MEDKPKDKIFPKKHRIVVYASEPLHTALVKISVHKQKSISSIVREVLQEYIRNTYI